MKTYVYQAVLTPDEDGGYDVEFPSLPGCFTCGDTIAEAAEQSVDAASTYVAALVKDEDGMYALRYAELIALNTAMIQRLMTRVDELEERLKKLEGGI